MSAHRITAQLQVGIQLLSGRGGAEWRCVDVELGRRARGGAGERRSGR